MQGPHVLKKQELPQTCYEKLVYVDLNASLEPAGASLVESA